MARAGDNGGVYHQLDESQRLFLDAWTTQMQRLLNRNKEKPYRRIAKSSSFTLKPLSPREVCDDQIRMGEKREQEKENSEAPQRNMKKKSDTPEEKSDTHERKFNYFAEASEVTKVLPAHEPLNLQYCKDSKISTDNSNEFTISISPSVQPLLQEFKNVFPKEIPHGLPPSRGIEHQVDLLPGASLPNRPTYKSNPQETQRKNAHAKVEYVKRLYDQVKVQIAKKNENYAKQANKKRKEVVLEPGDDPGHLRTNVFQEGGNDENHETGLIQAKGPSGEGRRPKWRRMKAQVEKDEGPEAETLLRLLIVAEGPN
ncbi:hypothetical protein HKD37_17G047630 [Glycine soja]